MKEYKGYKYDCGADGIWFVPLDEEGSKFIVTLDDSKRSGKREFIESANNEETCREFIDYIKK
jgi:hypothetical protein